LKITKNIIRCSLLILTVEFLSACSSVSVAGYANNSPKLLLQEFFNGTLCPSGIVKDRSVKVIRYFDASIDASWEDGVGTLDENCVFDDGEEQQWIGPW
jgi:hypothetical protein